MTVGEQRMGIAVRATQKVPRPIQFAISGGLGYLLGAALLFLFIDRLGMSSQFGYALQAAITFGFVWVMNRHVTWHDHTGTMAETLPTFLAYRLASLGLAWGVYTISDGRVIHLSAFGGSALTIHYQLANAIGVAFATGANYLACQHAVFVEHAQDRPPSKVRRFVMATLLASAAAGVLVAVLFYPWRLVLTIWVLNAVLMIAVALANVCRMVYGWETPERVNHVELTDLAPPELRISWLVPARHEPILPRTLMRLLESDYPRSDYEVLVVIAEDDPDTELLAREMCEMYDNVQLVIDYSPKKSKPRALETARPLCTGDLVGVVDAESLLAPQLLSYVNTLACQRPDISIFQGGVQLMNHRAAHWKRPEGAGLLRSAGDWFNSGTSWWRSRNCLEYYVWFMSRLRYQARAGFVPLGGNTVFIRREALDEVGGWDVECLTEDCDLGVRASVRGMQTVVFHHPDLITAEETPESLSGLIVQRTRWMTGFLQVLRKGDWKALPRRQRILAIEALTMPLFQAYAGVATFVSLVLAFTLAAPVPLVLFVWTPLIVTVVSIALEHAAFNEFTRTFQLRRSLLDSARFVIASPFYQLVLSVAAVRSVFRLARGLTAWEKTVHSGQHLAGLAMPSELVDVVPNLQAAS